MAPRRLRRPRKPRFEDEDEFGPDFDPLRD